MSTKQYEESTSPPDEKPPVGNLDQHSIMDAAEAIAGERGMAQLAHTMLSIVLDNAGAQRAYLLTNQEEEWGGRGKGRRKDRLRRKRRPGWPGP